MLKMKVDKERLKFVRFWARFVKENDPAIWSSQQKKLIDSVIRTALQDVESYIRIKKLAKRVVRHKREYKTP